MNSQSKFKNTALRGQLSVIICQRKMIEQARPLPECRRWFFLCDKEMSSFKGELYDIPIEMVYRGRGLVDISKVIKVFERATRSEDSTVLLQRCLEELQEKLQEVSGGSM